jgi:iron complex transport system substrate-binding protein
MPATDTRSSAPALAGLDLAGLDLDRLSIAELAAALRFHGAAHLSPIERVELAERLTRRRFIIGAGALGLGLISGCGPQEQAAAPTATSVSTGYPRTVQHRGGATTFTARPERVLAESNFVEFDNLLALGIPLLARGSEFAEQTDPAQDLLPWQLAADAASIPLNRGIYGSRTNLEELTQLKPDVLFIWDNNFSSVEDELYQQRSAIVPIIVVEGGIEGIRVVADVFAVPNEKVDGLISAAQAKLAAFSPPRRPSTITLFYHFGDGDLYLASAQHPGNELLRSLQLPTFTRPGDSDYPPFQKLSLELIPELEADLLLVAHDPGTLPAIDALEQQPLFQALPAVREGRYHRMSREFTVAFNRPTVLSIDSVVAGFTEVLST